MIISDGSESRFGHPVAVTECSARWQRRKRAMGDVQRLRDGYTQQAKQVLDRVVEVAVVERTLESTAEGADHGTAQE
jgi:hypothetical protein